MRLESRILLAIVFAFAAACPLAMGDDAADAIKQDQKLFEGHWQIVSLSISGNSTAEEDAKSVNISIDADGKLTIEADGKVVGRATLTIDPARKPKSIDMLTTEGENKGQVSMGIYEITEDTHRVCYAPPTVDRPTEFSSTGGSGLILAVLKRVPK